MYGIVHRRLRDQFQYGRRVLLTHSTGLQTVGTETDEIKRKRETTNQYFLINSRTVPHYVKYSLSDLFFLSLSA